MRSYLPWKSSSRNVSCHVQLARRLGHTWQCQWMLEIIVDELLEYSEAIIELKQGNLRSFTHS